MAANITGEFDVVAEFSIPAVNRVLAAMHRVRRFPHSVTFRVDDISGLGSSFTGPTVVGVVDAFGDAVANQQQIGHPNPLPGQLAATDPGRAILGQLVNPDALSPTLGAVRPSHLRGRAQLQLSPPRIEVDDATGTNATVLIDVMSRYFPDPNTPPLAEFVRGELRVTAPVTQAAQTNPKAIDVDIKASQASIDFTPAWSSQALSAQDLAGIDLAIRNALATGFEPSSIPVPSNINAMQLRTLSGGQTAVAALLNMITAPGNLASFTTIFTQPNDDFAFGVGVNYVKSVFQPKLTPVHYWVYEITPTSATIALEEGKIVVTVSGNAVGDRWWTKNFSFTLSQDFTLSPASMTPGGPLNTLELVPGDISGGVLGWLLNLFGSNLLTDSTQESVRQTFSADNNFGGLFASLLKPGNSSFPIANRFAPKATLTYTSAEIHTSGIVVHGSLAVSAWPGVHVEFQEIPVTGPTSVVALDRQYSALNCWIPGGTVTRYQLSSEGQAQVIDTETNKFILTQGLLASANPNATNAAVDARSVPAYAYAPLCLTVSGTRLSASGAVVSQNVSGTACGYRTFPLVGGDTIVEPPAALALAQRGTAGQVVVAGHLSAQLAAAGSGTPNRIVHFADDASAGNLQFLAQAFSESKRTDAPAALLAVLTADQLSKARYAEGVIYADNQNGAWDQVFGVKTSQRPLTLIVAPKGNVMWQHAGNLDSASLASALRKTLLAAPPVKLGMLRLTLRLGQPAPDFIFEYATGRQMTLHKLIGNCITLLFWKSSFLPSITAVLDLQKAAGPSAGSSPLILAINDGDPADVAKRVAARNGFSATVVTDPQREISFAYGVTIWPTMVTINAAGVVSEIRYGYVPGQQHESSSTGKTVASR